MAWHLTCRGQWTTCQPRSYDSKILYLWQMIATLPYPIPATNILGIKRQNLRTDIIWALVTWLLPRQLHHPLFPCPGWEETTHHSPLSAQATGHTGHWCQNSKSCPVTQHSANCVNNMQNIGNTEHLESKSQMIYSQVYIYLSIMYIHYIIISSSHPCNSSFLSHITLVSLLNPQSVIHKDYLSRTTVIIFYLNIQCQ